MEDTLDELLNSSLSLPTINKIYQKHCDQNNQVMQFDYISDNILIFFTASKQKFIIHKTMIIP